jgi:hypothetical protein
MPGILDALYGYGDRFCNLENDTNVQTAALSAGTSPSWQSSSPVLSRRKCACDGSHLVDRVRRTSN